MKKIINKYKEFVKLNEFKQNNKPMTDTETNEFDSFDGEFIGIKDITFWFGYNSKQPKNKIIKISNIKNEYNGIDCFDMSIETLETQGHINKSIITDDILKQIKKMVTANRDLLNEYSDGNFFMDEFIDRYVNINKKQKRIYNV
jgi:hypothetical protein